jgi:hypothetical protein
MNDSFICHPTRMGTLGGCLTIFLVNVSSGDILRTMLLAGIGAVVSFVVSLGLKWVIRWWRK